MIHNLKPYPAYKDSGVPWLRQIPKFWRVLPNRALFAEVKERDHPHEELLSVTITKGVIRQEALSASSPKKDSSNLDKAAYKLVRPGDIAYNKMRAWQGAVGASDVQGIVSPAYVVVRPRGIQISRYFHYLLRTSAFAKEAERWSYGITSDQWSLRPEHFKMIYCPAPTLPEQSAIVRFLDYADRLIQRYIRAKKKLIALLNEQRQAIIQDCVAHNSSQRTPLNILGLPVQTLPGKGWQSISVGHLIQKRWLTIQDGNHGELHPKASEYVPSGLPFLMAKDVRPEGVDLRTCAKISEERARSLRVGFAVPGDILLTHKASIGNVCQIPDTLEYPFIMLTPQVTYYRLLSDNIIGPYLCLYMQSRLLQDQLRILSLNQSTRPYVGLLEQRNLVICFPSVDRQLEIVRESRARMRPTDVTIERSTNEVDLLREYRTRLILDVVTGRLDVREAAARLPEEAEEMGVPYEDIAQEAEEEGDGTDLDSAEEV